MVLTAIPRLSKTPMRTIAAPRSRANNGKIGRINPVFSVNKATTARENHKLCGDMFSFSGQQEEDQVDMGPPLPPHHQPPESAQPGKGPLHHPPLPVARKIRLPPTPGADVQGLLPRPLRPPRKAVGHRLPGRPGPFSGTLTPARVACPFWTPTGMPWPSTTSCLSGPAPPSDTKVAGPPGRACPPPSPGFPGNAGLLLIGKHHRHGRLSPSLGEGSTACQHFVSDLRRGDRTAGQKWRADTGLRPM